MAAELARLRIATSMSAGGKRWCSTYADPIAVSDTGLKTWLLIVNDFDNSLKKQLLLN
jgi:hypothetical protein